MQRIITGKIIPLKILFWHLLLINVFVFIFFANFLPIRFEDNDDTIMCLIASGAYSGMPDAHLVFINYIYGYFLTFLYQLFSGIEWYTVSFCIIHIFSISIIFWYILKLDKSSLLKFIFILFFYLIEIRIILLFQFTTTAAISAFSGLLLLFCKNRYAQVAGIILFLIASLIRFDAAMLVLLLMLPAFVYQFIYTKISGKVLLLILCCICIPFGLRYVDKCIYEKDKTWNEYRVYNNLRGRINDNPNAGHVLDNLPEGISANDYTLFLKFFIDAKVFPLEKIGEINTKIEKTPLRKQLKNVFSALISYKFYLIIFLFLYIFSFFREVDRRKNIFLLLYFLFYILILSYISMNGALKPRVFVTTLFPFIYIFLLLSSDFISYRVRRDLPYIALCGLFILLSIGYVVRNRISKNQYQIIAFEEQLDILKKNQGKNRDIIPFSSDLDIEYYNPYHILNFFSKNRIFFSGWLTCIPFNKGHLDSYLSLVDTNCCIFISSKNGGQYIPLIQKALLDHYNCHTKYNTIEKTEHYILFQLVRQNETI